MAADLLLPTDTPSGQTLLGIAANEFSERLARGERPQVEEYVSRYPRIAHLIRDVFPAINLLREPSVAHSASRGDGLAWLEMDDRETLGDFRIIREIGRGGMGIVYEAAQLSMQRRVALKILPFVVLADDRRRKRFQNEVRAAATLDHPNIVSVYAVGEERGIHYYAMRLIRGQSLAAVVEELRQMRRRDGRKLDGRSIAECGVHGTGVPGAEGETRDASSFAVEPDRLEAYPTPSGGSSSGAAYHRSVARLGIEAALALEHAHGQGVIHRDIKPGNLLLSASGSLFVTDFGVARIGSDPGISVSAEIVGTLRYMSPEQALGRGVVDHRADIYSLGATLYELLTLRPVFEGENRGELLHQIALAEPHPVRQVDRSIPRDLETIVCKSLAKEVHERYATAQELREDLERFVSGRPISAKRVGAATRVMKLARRYPVGASLLSLSVVLLFVLAAVGWWSAAAVRDALDATRDLLYADDVRLAGQAIEAGNLVRARSLLQRHISTPGEEDRRGFAWHYLHRRVSQNELVVHTSMHGEATWLDCSPDGRLVVSGHVSGEIVLWSTRTWTPLASLRKHKDRIWQLCFSPDGTQLASAGDDGLVTVWDIGSRQLRASLRTDGKAVDAVAFAPDGETIAAAAGQEVLIWRWTEQAAARPLKEHLATVDDVSFSPDGRWLASVGGNMLVVWDWQAGTVQYRQQNLGSKMVSAAFKPDGKQIAIGTASGSVVLWDVAAHEMVHSLELHTSNVDSLQFSADGERLLSASKDMTVRLTDLKDWTKAVNWYRHDRRACCARLLPHDGRVVSCSRDETIRVWPQVKSGFREQSARIGLHPIGILSPDGTTIGLTSSAARVTTYFTMTGKYKVLPYLQEGFHNAGFSLDGTLLVTGGRAARSGGILEDSEPAIHRGDLDGDGDHDLIASAGNQGRLMWQERLEDGTFARPRLVAAHANERNDRQFAWSAMQDRIEFWRIGYFHSNVRSLSTDPLTFPVKLRRDDVAGPSTLWLEDLDNDQDLDLLLGTELDETIAWYERRPDEELGPRQVLSSQLGAATAIIAADVDEDGLPDVIAATSKAGVCWFRNLRDTFSEPLPIDGTIRSPAVLDILNVDTDGVKDLVVATTEGVVWFHGTGAAGFDGRSHIVETLERETWLRRLPSNIVLWDTKTDRLIKHFSGHVAGIDSVGLSPSTSRLATAGADDVVRIWDLPSGRFVRALPCAGNTIKKLFWADESTLLVAAGDGVNVWDLRRNRTIHEWNEHENTVVDIVSSPATPLVATLSHDYTVRLWSLATGQEQAILAGHRQQPAAGAFSSDGRLLATAGANGTVHLWDMTTRQELLTLTDFVVEELTDIGFRGPRTLIAVGQVRDELRVGIWDASSDANHLTGVDVSPHTEKQVSSKRD